MPDLLTTALQESFTQDQEFLNNTQLPIVTVSATYKEDLKGIHGFVELDTIPDVVFSRAHYSMAMGIAIQHWKDSIDPKRAWLIDPTNYVSPQDWSSVKITELIGKILARNPLLKGLKDVVDKFGRQKLPILDSITPPLLELTKDVKKPILSLHIATGNILATHGKQVIQVVTDPHVREDYLANAEKPNIKFCLFDQKTRTEFFEKAAILDKKVDPKRVIVTGPPIDPRIIQARINKKPWTRGPLKLCLATGGLGTNKAEIKKILEQLLPQLRKNNPSYQLMIYAGTQADIKDMVLELAIEARVKPVELELKDPAAFILNASLTTKTNPKITSKINHSRLSVVYHPQIVDANELLVKYVFPWADGFISKPSGDMAYDAVAAGCFLLTLPEWGEWEHNIREIFSQKQIARKAQINHIIPQLESLTTSQEMKPAWVTQAMDHALHINQQFLNGAQEIIKQVI